MRNIHTTTGVQGLHLVTFGGASALEAVCDHTVYTMARIRRSMIGFLEWSMFVCSNTGLFLMVPHHEPSVPDGVYLPPKYR